MSNESTDSITWLQNRRAAIRTERQELRDKITALQNQIQALYNQDNVLVVEAGRLESRDRILNAEAARKIREQTNHLLTQTLKECAEPGVWFKLKMTKKGEGFRVFRGWDGGNLVCQKLRPQRTYNSESRTWITTRVPGDDVLIQPTQVESIKRDGEWYKLATFILTGNWKSARVKGVEGE